MREYTKELAGFALKTRFEDLPEQVVTLAKKHMLDCVGAALAEAPESDRPALLPRNWFLGRLPHSGPWGPPDCGERRLCQRNSGAYHLL